MACHWRIRHKLLFGLGLVAGLIALLLGGTLYGLASYRATMKSIDSKVAELRAAEAFHTAIKDVRPLEEPGQVRSCILRAQDELAAYEAALTETLNRGRDSEIHGEQQRGIVADLRVKLEALDHMALERATTPDLHAMGASRPFVEEPKVRGVLDMLAHDSADLRATIYQDLHTRSKDASETFKTTLWIVFTTSGVGLLLMCGFMRFFYGWVFYPVRDLEQGAGRVAQGDFEHRIEVHSGDEMEDLAKAFNDMTGRLREIYRDLARQVNERSRQLVRSERLASVGFLAAGVAHEINNPLAGIAFCSEALEQRLAALLPPPAPAGGPGMRLEMRSAADEEREKETEVVTKYLKTIQREAFRCKAITQRLLEFSRGGERRREPTELAELVQSVLEVTQHLPNSKGKHIVFQPRATLTAWVNAQEIKSVVLNLVVNALDSMDEGGTLTIALAQHDHMAELVFSDTGCGMSHEILENIFEPFFTRSRTGKGTGLGLSISHRIVSQHGGEIEAASPGPGGGSTFTVRFPLKPEEPAREETLGHAAA